VTDSRLRQEPTPQWIEPQGARHSRQRDAIQFIARKPVYYREPESGLPAHVETMPGRRERDTRGVVGERNEGRGAPSDRFDEYESRIGRRCHFVTEARGLDDA